VNISDFKTIDFFPYPRFRNYDDAEAFQRTRDWSLCVEAFIIESDGRIRTNPDYKGAPYEERVVQVDDILSVIVKR
jgi:hypothetical protein